MGDVAGEAGGMAVQSSNRRRREKERMRKYRARKSGPVDGSAKIASQQMKRAKYDRTYKVQEHVKESDAEKKRNTRHSTKTAQQAGDNMSENNTDSIYVIEIITFIFTEHYKMG
jgi:hypothetical protein